ncbi:hypothetical protein CCH79_00001122, partial [Gambusia affinis]
RVRGGRAGLSVLAAFSLSPNLPRSTQNLPGIDRSIAIDRCILPFLRQCSPAMKEAIMNQEKLAKLQAQVRIGGKGSARRKKKVVHRTATADDKKLQFSLKKLGVNNISGIEEVGAARRSPPPHVRARLLR